MPRERDMELRKELIEQYKGMTLYREDAEFKLRLEFYEDVQDIKTLLKQIIDKMG